MLQRPPTLLGQYAGIVSRGIAFLLDILIITTTIAITTAAANAFLDFFGLNDFFTVITTDRVWLRVISILISALAAASFVVGYFVVLWVFTGGYTIGKWVMGVRIVRLDGHRLTIGRALIRYFMMLVSGIALFLGFIWVLVDKRRQTWHDKVARTCVIYAWDAREDVAMLESVRERLDYLRRTRERVKQEARELTHSSHSDETPALQPPPTADSPTE